MNAVRAMVGCSLMMFSMASGPVVQMAQAADKVIAGSLGGQAPLWAIYVAVHKSFFAARVLISSSTLRKAAPPSRSSLPPPRSTSR